MAPSGRVTRPAGSDSYWPPVGTVVAWRLHGVIAQMYDQAKRHGVAVKGTIGNLDHLRKHGGHTPWEPGKPREVVHAIDLEAPGLGDFILAICRTSEDTSFIQFMNWRGRQYDYGGNDVGASGDTHLHFHVRAGGEARAVKLIDRYANRNAPPVEEDVMSLQEEFTVTDPNIVVWPVGAEVSVERALQIMASRAHGAAVVGLENRAKLDALLAASGAEVQRDADARTELSLLRADQETMRTELLAAIEAVDPSDPEAVERLLARIRVVVIPEAS